MIPTFSLIRIAIVGIMIAMLATMLAIVIVMAFVTVIPIITFLMIAMIVIMRVAVLIIIPIMIAVMGRDAEILTRVNPIDIVDTIVAGNGINAHAVAGSNAGQGVATMDIVTGNALIIVIMPVIAVAVGID